MISALIMAFQALAANKLRSALTMLGTIIGVTCVVALWNIGESGRRYMSDALSAIGENIIFVHARYNVDEEDQRTSRYRPLGLGDVEEIRENCPSVKEASPVFFSGGKVIYGPRSRNYQIQGVYPSYLTIRNWQVENGAMFSEADLRGGARVALLGSLVAQELFGDLNPVGQKIRINQIPFLVIGVLKEKGSFFGQKQDDKVIAPFTTVADAIGMPRYVHMIFVSAREKELIPQAKNEILFSVRQSQKVSPGRRDPVDMQDMGEVAKSVDTVLLGITMLLGAIGAISLLVGGIGIMNIMLVSVTERTREIGLRIALGATDFNILTQFLIEAMVLSGVGGVVGAFGGAGVAAGAVKVLSLVTQREWTFALSQLSLIVAIVFAMGVGVFFGFYPAWRASRLDPIVALRRE